MVHAMARAVFHKCFSKLFHWPMQQGCTILNTQQAYDVAHDVVVRAAAGLYFFPLWAHDVTARAEAGLYKYLFGL